MLKTGVKSIISFTLALRYPSPLNWYANQSGPSLHTPTYVRNGLAQMS